MESDGFFGWPGSVAVLPQGLAHHLQRDMIDVEALVKQFASLAVEGIVGWSGRHVEVCCQRDVRAAHGPDLLIVHLFIFLTFAQFKTLARSRLQAKTTTYIVFLKTFKRHAFSYC